MGHRRVIERYCSDINNLTDILTKLVSSYRLLIGGAGELNGIALAKKKDVKDALKRVDKLGNVIDDFIEALDEVGGDYIDYCELKSEIIKCKLQMEYIETEIDEDLKLKE